MIWCPEPLGVRAHSVISDAFHDAPWDAEPLGVRAHSVISDAFHDAPWDAHEAAAVEPVDQVNDLARNAHNTQE